MPVKIKIVRERYATVRPSARPSPSPPPSFVGHADCPRHAARSHAAGGHAARSTLLYAYPLLYAHPPLYKPTRHAGFVGHCGLWFFNDPQQPTRKKARQQKARRVVCGSLWVMWAVILNRCRSRVLHRKCSTTENLNYQKTITHNHPQTAQTRIPIGFARGSLSALHHPQNNPRQPTSTHKNTVTNCYKYLYKNTLTSVRTSLTL